MDIKKALMLVAIILSSNTFAEEIIKDENCVLIKENRLLDYLPKEEVNYFLENKSIDTIEAENVIYTIKQAQSSVSKRIKTYKVCANYKEK
jgi:hypothetical protein